MRSKGAIALISSYDHPSRDSIERMLRGSFPEFAMTCLSTTALIKKHRRWWLPNSRFLLREYGARLARRTIGLKPAYLQTSYIVRRLREHMREVLDPTRYAFSLQIQSLYDTAVPGIPHYIYTDHTHLSNLSSEYFDRRLLRSDAWIELERGAYHHSRCVFTRSSNVTHDLITQYGLPAAQVECVYAGSNVRATTPRLRASDPESVGQRRVLFVGSDWERKGGPVLATAFEEVLRVVPAARLTIAGASPKLHLANCDLLGLLPLEQLSRHYANAAVFCLPTRLEPFGIAFLEAMAHRLPVIGARIGAIPDMVIHGVNGYLVEPGDPQQLAKVLIDCLLYTSDAADE